MATMKIPGSVEAQLDAGASILAAAQTVDTRLIKASLSVFAAVQREYKTAHDKVQAAGNSVGVAQMRLGELDVEQSATVDAVARALIAEGRPRGNPFRDLLPLGPGRLVALPAAEEAKTIHQLVQALRQAKGIGKPTLAAAQAAEKAALAVERQVAEIDKLQSALRAARNARAPIAQKWATALAGLKRWARAASEDGAPQVHSVLFDRPNRPRTKTSKPGPTPTPPAPVPPAS